MSKIITTLEQLRQLRNRAVQDISGRLSSQKQLCQRYERNIAALTELSAGVQPVGGCSALLMNNQSGYKKNIQRVIEWQKQEQALADIQAKQLQAELIHEARREKSVELVLEQRRDLATRERERQAQKVTDGISAQCWLRRQAAIR
ncbi:MULTISPECIES: flagellar export protein FliJ [Hafnia]|uniref:Flagellar FliJ protein n=1 Tax=Hafnia alvei ATCC 51873 TaxID=1002364 RepID=G9YDH7_HAFAL|nr:MULTISPECIES: flagellar export protein FliJ [Hafnia]EHM37687.1 flagellar export protein FliJ [Hafnia alvei ATCC 51873]OFS10684.1 flagellar export protein FliJ [Hafnia sp. HMSC23F03]QQE42902.1 flagellar export protein FliJ [Hafnia alvei]